MRTYPALPKNEFFYIIQMKIAQERIFNFPLNRYIS